MVAKAEILLSNPESGNGRKAAEEKIRGIWRDFYGQSIDEETRKRQLEEAIDSSPPDVQEWLLEAAGNKDSHKPINRMMRLAEEELVKAVQPQSKGEKIFVRREKARIRRY